MQQIPTIPLIVFFILATLQRENDKAKPLTLPDIEIP